MHALKHALLVILLLMDNAKLVIKLVKYVKMVLLTNALLVMKDSH